MISIILAINIVIIVGPMLAIILVIIIAILSIAILLIAILIGCKRSWPRLSGDS